MPPPGAGVHRMRVLNNTKRCWIEATMENINFVMKAIHEWQEEPVPSA